MRPMTNLAEWDGALPAMLVGPAGDQEARRGLLRALAARVLHIPPELVVVAHGEGRAPWLLAPEASGLCLSSASRAGMAALAVGRGPIGVDIEAVEPGIEPPWNVLHPDERACLSGLAPDEQGRSFARIWAAKEAYLKALATGLGREPSSFAALPADETGAEMRMVDPGRPAAKVTTAWVTREARDYAVAWRSFVCERSRAA
jgi:phosphopantetheinyl transferase